MVDLIIIYRVIGFILEGLEHDLRGEEDAPIIFGNYFNLYIVSFF
jgi:hypothetical protein